MRVNKRTLVVAGLALLGAVIYGARGLLFSEVVSDHEILMRQIDEVAAATEGRDLRGVTEVLAESFKDQRGRDRQGVIQFLRAMFVMQQKISVYVVNKEVELAGPDSATARVDAVITRGVKVKKLADVIPEAARALRFSLGWVKEGEKWLLRSAKWTGVADVRELLR